MQWKRIKKINKYRKQKCKQKVFYVLKEIEDKEYYIFLKLAKQLRIKTFKKENDYKIYYVEEEIKKFKKKQKRKLLNLLRKKGRSGKYYK